MRQTVSGDQLKAGQRSKDCRSSAVTGHRQADRQAAFVREPLRHDRNRGRVAESVTQPGNDAECQIEVVQRCGVGAEEESQADKDSADQRNLEGPEFVLQAPCHHERDRENEDGVREYVRHLGAAPPKLFLQRSDKHAPRVKTAESEIHGKPADHAPPTTYAIGAGVGCNICVSHSFSPLQKVR